MNEKKVDINTLDIKYIDEIASVASECFANDKFFLYLGEDINIRKQKLKEMYQDACKIALKLGYILGIFSEDRLVSVVLLLDYDKLKKSKKYFQAIFDVDENDCKQDTYKFLEMAEKFENALYLLSIFTDSNFQGQGYASQMVSYITRKFNRPIISDVDNVNSLSMYKRENFNIEKISDDTYFVSK